MKEMELALTELDIADSFVAAASEVLALAH